MDPRHIPPSLQRRWAEEVLYLHSLWHQGPPQNPNANPNRSPSPSPNLRPINCTQYKKPKNKRNKKRKDQSQATNPPPPAPEIEWPVNPSPDRNAEPAGWPEPAPNPHARPPPSAEERARASALWVQQAVLKSCREFLAGSDEDEDELEEEDEEDAEAKAFEFFLGVFENGEELRGYYVKSNEKGEFLCLVCGGTGVKLGKRYGDCVGLVQHSSSIGKTKRRGAHRGFGQAVCKVLGWDINRLPSIVLDRGEPLGQSLVKEGEMQDDLQEEDDVREIVEISNEDNSNEDLMDCLKEKKIEILNKGDANDEKDELLNTDDEKKHQICSPSNVPAGEIFWPCEPSWRPKPDAIGWENLILVPDNTQPRQLPSEEEQARVAAAEVQQKALMACQDFLAKSDDSSSLDEDMDEEEVDKRDSLALNFFLMLFARNDDLRNYYEKNRSKGEFLCWVCWGIGKKTWKRFGDCLGLVQHSKSISSTKRKWAHQAFAKAVCQVLGWNIDGNPSIVLPSKESQAQHSVKSAKTQDDTSKDGSDDCQEETAVCGIDTTELMMCRTG